MNRLVASGLLAEAAGGARVLFVGEDRTHARAGFEACCRSVVGAQVSRALGRERIGLGSGGSVEFIGRRSSNQWMRGRSFDLIYVDCDLPRDDIADLTVAALPAGELLLR